jgi:rSAM/selenodomain-associated transferase 1
MPSPPHAAELLILFVKYPEPGRVKTRLAAGVGPEQAAAIYQDLVERAWRAASDWCRHAPHSSSSPPPSRTLWLYFDPPSRESEMKAWFARYPSPPDLPIIWIAQPEGDLGERLEYVFDKAFKEGFSAVSAIGTDCPSLTAKGLETASLRLRLSDAVIGPAADGGYYLIGLTRYHPNAFRKIPWSSTQTLAATLAALRLLSWNVAELPMLHDIDTQADWELWLQSSTHLSKPDQSGLFYDEDL